MISVDKLSLRRGENLLFSDARFSIFPGHKVGLTGSNGTGKSSLFALLKGDLAPDRGVLDIQPNMVISSVAQELPSGNQSALEFVIDGDLEFRDIEKSLAVAEASSEAEKIAELHERLLIIDGYGVKPRASRLLSGLGFSVDELSKPIDFFSGGWRMRLNLGRALMCRSDLLLLDEPTNHLDIDAVIWLESWLKKFKGTLLLISHDRQFLDNVIQEICHIEDGIVRTYKGNYTEFEMQRAAHLAEQKSLYIKQRRDIDRMESFVRRFKAKATKARQAQSRLKQLDKLARIIPAHTKTQFKFEFISPKAKPDPAITARGVSIGYDGKPLLSDINLELRSGARIGLLGKNGAGKSTLIRFLSGKLAALAGETTKSKDLSVGYFEQNSIDQLRDGETPLQHLVRVDSYTREQELRNFLGGFGFVGNEVFREVRTFSGGERSRLALALIVWERPNVLLLDEPTNHLDMEMRHALTVALQTFEGAMILVSHDRSLISAVCDQLFIVYGGVLSEYEGDLDDYTNRLLSKVRSEGEGEATSKDTRKVRRRLEAQERNTNATLKKPVIKQIKIIEEQIEKLQKKKLNIELTLSDPKSYDDNFKNELLEYLRAEAQVSKKLVTLEKQWFDLSSQLERIDGNSVS